MSKITLHLPPIMDADIQAEVQSLLKWPAEQYSDFIYQTGCEFLHQLFPGDADAIAQLETRVEFWNWFKNQWKIKDEVFISSEGIAKIGTILLRNMYYALHCPETMAAETPPNRVVLGKNFHHVKTTAQ